MPQEKSNIRERQRNNLQPPKHYNVIIFNDDFTTMEFVVDILMKIFTKSFDAAQTLMLKVHKEGKAVVGTYSLDMALSKAAVATRLARDSKFPLKFEVEEA